MDSDNILKDIINKPFLKPIIPYHFRFGDIFSDYHELIIKDLEDRENKLYIIKRPHYCDRGHYMLQIDGYFDLDSSDGFPRYFFTFEEAETHARKFLAWRLLKIDLT